jgi:transcription antitermination factor NusG
MPQNWQHKDEAEVTYTPNSDFPQGTAVRLTNDPNRLGNVTVERIDNDRLKLFVNVKFLKRI